MEVIFDDKRSINLKAGTMVQLPLELTILPCEIALEYDMAQGANVAFGVEMVPSQGLPKHIVPLAVGAPKKLCMEFKNEGVCTFTWDYSSAWFGAQEITYRIVVKVSETQLKLHNAATAIQSMARMSSARGAYLGGEFGAPSPDDGDAQTDDSGTFRFTDDASPTKPASFKARAAASPKAKPKPKKETPETLRAKIEKLHAKAASLDEKLLDMTSGVEKAELAVDAAKDEVAKSKAAVEEATGAVAVIEGKLAELGVDDASTLVAGEAPAVPVSYTETILTVF